MEQSNILEIYNVTKSFGKFLALKNVSFDVKKGRIVGLLGKNGAGKTTLIKTILGLLRNFDGKIMYDGRIIDTSNPAVMNTIGSLVETSFHEDLSAFDNLKLLMMSTPIDGFDDYKQRIYELLTLVDLKAHAKSKVKSFSFGMKQRLALAQALLTEPKLLILDEPFVGLDPPGIELIKNKLTSLCHDNNVSIIFSSHQLSDVAEISDDIVVISGGEIGYCGSYEQLLNDSKRYRIHLRQAVTPEMYSAFDDSGIEVIDDGKVVIAGQTEINSDDALNQALKQIYAFNLEVSNISVEENALIGLFSD